MAKEDKEKKLVLEQLADQEGNPVLFEGNPLLITHPNPKNPLFYQAFRASRTPVDGHWLVEALSGYGDPNLTIQQGTDIQGRIVGVTSGIERLPIKIHYSALQHLKEKYPGAEIEDRTPYAQSQPKLTPEEQRGMRQAAGFAGSLMANGLDSQSSERIPTCPNCNVLMVVNGSIFKCINCGDTLGG